MKTFTRRVAGEEVTIKFPEHRDDLAGFRDFVVANRPALAFDTEGTGLDIFAPGHRTRLVQFGDTRTAWVLRADLFMPEIRWTLTAAPRLVAHNAAYDILALYRCGMAELLPLIAKTFDSRILSHLIDPRGKEDGGVGQGLKDLCAHLVDAEAPDSGKELQSVFRGLGANKNTGWAIIPVDHPKYVEYAGLDTILTARLFAVLGPLVRERGLSRLAKFEHAVAGITTRMMAKGVKLDVPYAEKLEGDLHEQAAEYRAKAARLGVQNVNAPKQVVEALLAMGETFTEKTASGAWKADKAALLPMADLTMQWRRIGAREPNPLADAILRAKRADKWATAYVRNMLDMRDADDRIHPWISPLQARTARMSISRPALQQLPSSDWTIRRALVADPGHVIVTADYEQIEMRVLAALANEQTMIRGIKDGLDLHTFTAQQVAGDRWDGMDDEERAKFRKLMKGTGFGKVYGGGAATLSRQTGAPIEAVQRAIDAYDRTFPGIKRYQRRLQNNAQFGSRMVETPSGRQLPLDRDRLYAATNYTVQSTAADILKQALLELDDAGLTDHLLLPVHDELVAQAPEDEAEDFARELGRCMSMDFMGVPIDAEGEVVGPTWGHAYGAAA